MDQEEGRRKPLGHLCRRKGFLQLFLSICQLSLIALSVIVLNTQEIPKHTTPAVWTVIMAC